MAIALVQGPAHGDITIVEASKVVPITATTAGSLIVVIFIGRQTGDTFTVTDSGGNTYTRAVAADAVESINQVEMSTWYLANAPAGITSVTCGLNQTGSTIATIRVYEFSGAKTSVPLDTGIALNNQLATPPVLPSITPSVLGELLIGTIFPNVLDVTSVSAGWTFDHPNLVDGTATCYIINPALSAQQAVFQPTTAQSFCSCVVSFLPPSTGPSNAVKTGAILAAY